MKQTTATGVHTNWWSLNDYTNSVLPNSVSMAVAAPSKIILVQKKNPKKNIAAFGEKKVILSKRWGARPDVK